MHELPEISGWKSSVYWRDGSRSWEVAIQEPGETHYWRVVGSFGHGQMEKEVVVERAAEIAREAIEMRLAHGVRS